MLTIARKAILKLKIGQKLGIVLGLIVVQLALLVGLATWSLRLLSAGMDQGQQQSERMVLALNVSSDLAEIGTQMGNLIISADLKLDNALVFSLQRDYVAALAAMKASSDSTKGKKLVGNLQTAVERWKKGNEEVVRLAGLGQRDAASNYYRTEYPDRYGDAKAAVGDLLEYRRDQLNTINTQRNVLLKKITVALLGIGFTAILIAVICGWKITRSISRPLKGAVVLLSEIAGGDVSRDVSQEFMTREDEFGALAQAMQTMSVNLRSMVREISGGVEVLSASSRDLLASSTQMTSGSQHASDKAHLVSAAAEQMSANISSVAEGMEQATTNLENVASATQELTSTIGEIAVNSSRARKVTDDAMQQAAQITRQISQLGEATKAIGEITETIAAISSQTNLLALNATIEAARAGAAGKGFAVVATEIKALAKQTAVATEDIKGRISGVQTATTAGIAEIGKVSQVIQDVSTIVASIAAAIDEQAEATNNIAQNIAGATAGVSNANGRVSETSHVSREIAKDIVSVDQTAGEMAGSGEKVRSSAMELSMVAEQLMATVSRFRS